MRDYIASVYDKVEDRLTQVSVLRRMNKYVIPVLLVLCGVAVFASLVGIIGGIGTWDFYEEIGQLPTHEEEVHIYYTVGVSMLSLVASLGASSFLYRLREWNDSMIIWRREQRRRNINRRIQEMVAEIRRENMLAKQNTAGNF